VGKKTKKGGTSLASQAFIFEIFRMPDAKNAVWTERGRATTNDNDNGNDNLIRGNWRKKGD